MKEQVDTSAGMYQPVNIKCGGFNAIFAWTTYRGLVDFVPVYLIGKMSVPTCMVMGFAWEVLVF